MNTLPRPPVEMGGGGVVYGAVTVVHTKLLPTQAEAWYHGDVDRKSCLDIGKVPPRQKEPRGFFRLERIVGAVAAGIEHR